MRTTIHIIGLGVIETEQLSQEAKACIQSAELIIGSERQLAVVNDLVNEQSTALLPKLSQLKAMIEDADVDNIVILASGDPLYYGIGRWFSKQFAASQLRYYPAVSSIQAACHRIGLSLQDARVISLHGRPVLTLRRHLAQHPNLVILTDQNSSPQALAELCNEAGFSDSTLTVCERLGYADEVIKTYTVNELTSEHGRLMAFDPLHVTIISVRGQAHYLPSFPGIADHHFITDNEAGRGLITKREVRLAILSLLQAAPNDVAWDIGAGCGGVAVEWALWNPLGTVYAIEHHAKRFHCLEQNQQRFGVVDNLKLIEGRAPEVLAQLPAANKIFIGGSDGELEHLLYSLWQTLPENGVMVASAVMESTRSLLLQFADQIERADSDNQAEGFVETMQMSVSRGGKLAGQRLYRPSLTVTLFKFTKHPSSRSHS
ncbi:precorrin-6y C5,15-methyltransferase (decarboxylating) subunit CbiE [Leucothrix sargassi]|nr:precorrin-6y C5,15-methyltransferase (decarboxylating) subunit CbiE [Leucothrix sargassi]